MITDQQYLQIADEAFDEALEIVRSSDGWKVEKEDKENKVLVEMKKNKSGKKIYRCKVSKKIFLLMEIDVWLLTPIMLL